MSVFGGVDDGVPYLDPDVPGGSGEFIFRTPTRANPRYTAKSSGVQRALYRHFPVAPVGVAVLQTGDTFVERAVPTHDQLEAADKYWMGGAINPVTTAEAAALTDAGYGSNLVNIGGGATTTGIDEDGVPYIDPDGVAVGDEAVATIEDGVPVFTTEGA